MPNYRAVSAGTIPPPPTLKQAFKIATQNSFDYSAFLFTGFTSAIADAQGTHKQLGTGVPGYWAYYWRGFVDKTDGNYLVIFALPTIFHQDERYYAMGKGSIGKRALYAASRILITPDYHGPQQLQCFGIIGTRHGARSVGDLLPPYGSIRGRARYQMGIRADARRGHQHFPRILA